MRGENGSQTSMLPGIPESAICVQRFDDSLILQFTILIAIRYVLHRCESQEIRCQKLYIKLIIKQDSQNEPFGDSEIQDTKVWSFRLDSPWGLPSSTDSRYPK